MNKNKPGTEFWILLAALNILVLIDPISRVVHASSLDVDLFATCVLVESLFLLLVADAVTVVVTGAVDTR